MQVQEKNSTSPFRKLGFEKLEAAEIISKLNISLCTYQVFFHKLQNFHWNVIGSDFFDVHDITEKMYKESLQNIDEIAERVRVFGEVPEVKISNYMKNSIIEESSYKKSAEFMIMDITKDIEKLAEVLLEVHSVSNKNGDIGTSFMITKMMKSLETYHWQLSAWTNKKYS